jgi:uncharacterized protein YsxB (DUF464 family)
MKAPEQLDRYLDPKSIEVYLLAHHWESRTRNSRFSTWRRPERPESAGGFLFVPLSPTPVDYEDRLWELVQRLAGAEGRDVEEVITNLRYATADLVRISLVSPRVGPGELPIEDGRRLFDGARDLMLYAACAAIHPRTSFGTRPPAAAKDYMEGVRLGQTERGSYVVTVISDVAPAEQQALLAQELVQHDTPFERRVTSRLMESLSATRSAAQRVVDDHANVAESFEDVVEQGVSAQLCGAISKIAEQQAGAHIDVRMNWAASRPSASVTVPPAVNFPPSVLPVLSEAYNALRQHGPFDDVVVEGYVTQLNRGKDEEAIGSVVIDGHARGEKRKVHVELPDSQYHLAVRAHDARYPVRVLGTLAKRGRFWVLGEPGQLMLEGVDS